VLAPTGGRRPRFAKGTSRLTKPLETPLAGIQLTWVSKTFCVYDGPSPEAIRKAAARNGLPVERITQVRVLDPYVYPRDRKESEGTG
jgi:hypothetical protein